MNSTGLISKIFGKIADAQKPDRFTGMKVDDQIKLFGLNNLSIEAAIKKTKQQLGIPFRQGALKENKDDEFIRSSRAYTP